MGFNLLSLGSQAVKTNQSALAVVGQNISNVNTEGYSRQVVHFNSTIPNGVEVADVERVTNEFLTQQFWTDTSNHKSLDLYTDYARSLDNLLGKSATSLTVGIDSYFEKMQNAVDDPTSLANRKLFLEEADSLTQRFNLVYDTAYAQNTNINSQIDDTVTQINNYASSIADYNSRISLAETSGNSTSELRDQRDLEVAKLAELIDVQVSEAKNETYSIFVGNGQPLVVDGSANTLSSQPGNPDGTQNSISLNISGNSIDITEQVAGGVMGGMIRYRNEILNPTLNEIGRIAIAFADTMNSAQSKGMDLNNNLGKDNPLFSDINSTLAMQSRITANNDNTAIMKYTGVTITDSSKLTGADYELEFTQDNEFTIKNLSTGKVTAMSELQKVTGSDALSEGTYIEDMANGQLTVEIDGMRINLNATRFFSGDEYLIQPTRSGADMIKPALSDPKQLALASPVRITPNAENTGTGIATVKVTDIDADTFQTKYQLTPPVEIVFSDGDPLKYTAYDMTDPAKPKALDIGYGVIEDKTFTSGKAIDLGGYEVTITNLPKPGDRFTLAYNKDGFSDNRNALEMSDLQKASPSFAIPASKRAPKSQIREREEKVAFRR